MAMFLVTQAGNLPAQCWVLGVFNASEQIQPPTTAVCSDKKHIAAMQYAFLNTGTIRMEAIEKTSTTELTFGGLETGEKLLIMT